jgi:hypothetical protein
MSSDMILGVAIGVFGLLVIGLGFTVSEFKRIRKDESYDTRDRNVPDAGTQRSP